MKWPGITFRDYSFLTGRVAQLSKQCQDWSHTLDSVQEARAQERVESQQIIAAKVTSVTS